jgi:hypothetical protein
MLKFVKSHGLEGVVAKRADRVYQPGLRRDGGGLAAMANTRAHPIDSYSTCYSARRFTA